MMKNPFILVAFTLFFSIAALGQISVFHANNPSGQPLKNGAFYILPQTTFKIDVVIRADEKIKGPYSDYAERFFGLENINNFSFTTYSIEKVIVTPISEPDPTQLYYVEFGERDAREPRSFTLQIDQSGFPVSANNNSMRGAAEPKSPREIVLIENADGKIEQQGFYPLALIEPTTDTIIRRVTVGTEVAEQSFYRMRLNNLPAEEMAIKALSSIEEIREMKLKLLTGFQETAYDAGTIRFMVEELTKQENELFDLFRGKTNTYHEHYTFYHTPDKAKANGEVNLFRFSSSEGITSGRGSGKFVQLEIEPMGHEQVAATFQETGAKNGFAYRVPGYATIKVKLDDDVFLEEKLTVNQYGAVKRLPAQRFDATFYPETGGIKSVVFE